MSISVLVVDDDLIACSAHLTYVERVPGFRGVDSATNAAEALHRVFSHDLPPIDLVLLDMNLPDRHGLEVIRVMRSERHPADIIAVTSARELDTLRAAISQGVVQYLLKPFAFAALRDRLERYASYRRSVTASTVASGQPDVDELVGALRSPGITSPAGLVGQTVAASISGLRSRLELSAPQLAELIGTSRVTARRYLEHLVDIGCARRDQRYLGTGRPTVVYRWQEH